MPPTPRILAALSAALLMAGCTSGPVGDDLGSISYVRDKQPSSTPVTYVYAGTQIDTLATLVHGLQNPELSRRLDGVDGTTDMVVTVYFDACAKADPQLTLNGDTLTVRYGAVLNRNCVRAVDTLALFAVPRSALPDPVTFQACGRSLTITSDGVQGEPIGLC